MLSEEAVLPPEGDAYRAFWSSRAAASGPGTIRVSLAMVAAPSESGRVIFESQAHWSIRAQSGSRIFVDRDASGPVLAVRFEPGARDVSAECSPVWRVDSPTRAIRCPLRYPVDQILAMYLLGARGLVLHAAGMIVRGRAVVLAGVSGAGKTTLCRLAAGRPGWEALSDDRIIVRLPDGTREACAHGTPWPGEGRIAVNRSAPLARVIFLARGDKNDARSLPAREAAARLVPTASIPWYDEDRVGGSLEACERLLDRVPAALLAFRPDEGALEAVEGLLE